MNYFNFNFYGYLNYLKCDTKNFFKNNFRLVLIAKLFLVIKIFREKQFKKKMLYFKSSYLRNVILGIILNKIK